MTNSRLVAYALIAIGVVALLSRLTGDAGWLWVGLVGVAFLLAYRRERLYAFLVLGSVLLGAAVGILLEGSWHWPGAFLVSLGTGFAAVDLTVPRPNRWPRTVGLVLIAMGIIAGLAEARMLTSSSFAVLLIAAGVVLVLQARRRPAVPSPLDGPAVVDGEVDATGAAVPSGEETPASGPSSDAALRAALERWRRATAHAEGRSETRVLTDASLDAIVRSRPQDAAALAKLAGIGRVRLERYGAALLALVAGTDEARD